MNLVLHGIEDFQIVREDTLRSPAFTDSSTGGLATFDCVIANPPFSLKEWGREVWEADPWGRAAFGLPPESYGDYAWVQHMVASMAAGTGRMAVVLPQGALFRKGAEGRIRQALLEQDLIEAVIGLAPNIFYGTGLAPAVVVLRRAKPAERKGKVLVIDASSLFRKGRAQNFLDPEHAAADRRLGAGLRGRRGPRQGRRPRRDRGRGLDAQHLPLRAAARSARTSRRFPRPSPRSSRRSPKRAPPRTGCARCSSREAGSREQGRRTSEPAGARVVPLGRGQAAARADRRRRLQAVRLPAALLQAAVGRVGRGVPAPRSTRPATPPTRARLPTTASRSPKARTGRTSAPPRATWAGRCSTRSARSRPPIPSGSSGIFGNASWTDKAQMPDETLKNLIEHFSQHDR